MLSNQASSSLPFSSNAPPSLSPIVTTSLSPPSSPHLPSSLSQSSNNSNSGPEVRSLFAYEPYILKPFMGLHSVDRPDDPWLYKNYDLHQPLYTGGGTFEPYLETERYKRDLESSSSLLLSTHAGSRHVLTPEMLDHLLYIKSNFKKHYPLLYKAMMDQLSNEEKPISSISPEERNPQLAAAEINPLDSVTHTYTEDLKNILEMQKQREKQYEYLKELIKSSRNDSNISDGAPQNHLRMSTPPLQTFISTQHHEEPSFWEEPQNTLNIAEERQASPGMTKQFSLHEQQSLFENPPDNSVSFLENSEAHRKDKSREYISESQHFRESPQATSSEQLILFNNPQDIGNEEQNLLETTQNFHGARSLPHKISNSTNIDHSIWQPSALQKRHSFWTELEASEEERKEDGDYHSDDLEPIFDFDENFD